MINLNIGGEGARLALTEAKLGVLDGLVAIHDCAGFYVLYNGFSDNDQASVQARVASFNFWNRILKHDV